MRYTNRLPNTTITTNHLVVLSFKLSTIGSRAYTVVAATKICRLSIVHQLISAPTKGFSGSAILLQLAL